MEFDMRIREANAKTIEAAIDLRSEIIATHRSVIMLIGLQVMAIIGGLFLILR